MQEDHLSAQSQNMHLTGLSNMATDMSINSAAKPGLQIFDVLNPANIGEALNTPIMCRDAEFNFTSISEEESINITSNTSTTSTQQKRSAIGHTILDSKASTQFCSNIKDDTNTQQMLYQQKSLAMSPNPWGELFLDCPAMEYSPIDQHSPESPVSMKNSPLMPLGLSNNCETSYSWYVDGEELTMPLSQKEETMCLANAHLHISQSHKSPSDHSYSISRETKLKLCEDSYDDFDDGYITTDNSVLYRDTMVSDASKIVSFIDEDTNLETVNSYNEILIKKEEDTVDDNYMKSGEVDLNKLYCETKVTDSELDSMERCQSVKRLNETVERISCLSTITDDFKLCNPIEAINFMIPEIKAPAIEEVQSFELSEQKRSDVSNSISTVPLKLTITRTSNRKEEKKSNRMRHYKSELSKLNTNPVPAKVKSVLDYEQQQTMNTPDIIEETLNLEQNDFDLINFICNQEIEGTTALIATPIPSPKSPVDLPDSPATEASVSPSVSEKSIQKRKRLSVSLYENPSSVQSYQSSVDEPQPKKKRGRPPKTHSSLPSPSQLEGLTEQDLRYWEMRNKNNEASRRSRLHRKQKEQSLEQEAESLVRQHQHLVAMENRLKEKVARLEIKLKEAIQ
ncbi:uncharacterized protein LOC129798426 isoform X1 [Phlebotomus papatasi]|uniref:uncharacterized protein LOC129798426 isoform X1 n=2 Tax=Phlebotomus papatasi TaxID=29031 RepID=UPI0024844250|nr:uncharacterized protein LOC129798426 isoform X1 [Phlebotomus papatasi]